MTKHRTMVRSYRRKGYTKSDGTRVKGSLVRGHSMKTHGSRRSRGSKHGPYSSKRGYQPWITRSGKLGGPGFLSRPVEEQKSILDSCVRRDGYRSCLDSVLVLSRNKSINRKHGSKIRQLADYMEHRY